jgi:hypothetical protein
MSDVQALSGDIKEVQALTGPVKTIQIVETGNTKVVEVLMAGQPGPSGKTVAEVLVPGPPGPPGTVIFVGGEPPSNTNLLWLDTSQEQP